MFTVQCFNFNLVSVFIWCRIILVDVTFLLKQGGRRDASNLWEEISAQRALHGSASSWQSCIQLSGGPTAIAFCIHFISLCTFTVFFWFCHCCDCDFLVALARCGLASNGSNRLINKNNLPWLCFLAGLRCILICQLFVTCREFSIFTDLHLAIGRSQRSLPFCYRHSFALRWFRI